MAYIGQAPTAAIAQTADIADNAITTAKIAPGTVIASDIAAGSITAEKIATGAVTANAIAENSVVSSSIVAGAVTGSRIAVNAVSSDKIANSAVITEKIVDSGVTTDKIANSAIITDKINNNAVTSDKLATQITLANLTVSGNITLGQAFFESANIFDTGVGANITLVSYSSGVAYYTANATANTTVNLTGVSQLSTGGASTFTLLMTNGSTPYKVDNVQVEGTSSNIRWLFGATPVTGYASNIDVYSFTVIKTGTAAYTVLASQSNFG